MVFEQYKTPLIEYANQRGFSLNLDNPKTINDKINWIKLNPTSLKTKCADKIAVHEYCKDVLGEDICIPIIKTYNKSSEIKFDELPNSFVIKCNHGCGYNIIVKDKHNINKSNILHKLDSWMSTNFSFVAGYEMQYDRIPHKIFVEKYMGDIDDFKFWCFNGTPKFWTHSLGNNGGLTNHINYYDMECNLTDINNMSHPRNPDIKCVIPNNFNEVVETVKALAKDFDFVRVDVYIINGKVYLGELTFTPGSGWMRYSQEDSIRIGDMLTLNKVDE